MGIDLSDEDRERVIAECGRLSLQGNATERRYWWQQMKYQIGLRSPAQIARMEKAIYEGGEKTMRQAAIELMDELLHKQAHGARE